MGDKPDPKLSEFYYGLGTVFMWLAVGSGVVLFGVPAVEWLKSARWSAWDGWTIVDRIGADPWFRNPDRALGLHKIVSFFLGFPLWFAVPAVLGLVAKGFNDAGDEYAAPVDTSDFDRY